VTLSLSSGPTYTELCSVDAARNGLSPTVCRTMYSMLVTAKLTGKSVLIRFYDHDMRPSAFVGGRGRIGLEATPLRLNRITPGRLEAPQRILRRWRINIRSLDERHSQ
jgi:hypothetical protein